MRETLATRRRACGQSNLSGVHDIAMRTQAGEHLVEHAPERWLRSQNSSTSATSSAAVLDPASTGFASPRSSTFTVPTLDEFHSIKTSQSMTGTILSAFPDDFSSVPFSLAAARHDGCSLSWSVAPNRLRVYASALRGSPSPAGGKAVADASRASRSSTLPGALCVVILLGMAATVAYIAWIAVLNFSRIGV